MIILFYDSRKGRGCLKKMDLPCLLGFGLSAFLYFQYINYISLSYFLSFSIYLPVSIGHSIESFFQNWRSRLFLTFCMTLKLLEYYELGEAGHLNSYYIRLSVHVVKIPPKFEFWKNFSYRIFTDCFHKAWTSKLNLARFFHN